MSTTNGKKLIFLISQPRAGSTLLQLMLAGHPELATTSEPWIALHPIYALRDTGIDTVYDSQFARQALLDFLKQSGLDEKYYKNQIGRFLMSFYSQSLEFQKKKIFLDKTPRYYNIIFELAEIFPEAKFIILFRNPLAVFSSILKTWGKDDFLILGECKDDLLIAPKKMVDFVEKHPERCYKVQYEDIITEAEVKLREICKFLEIHFQIDMLDYSDRLHPEWNFGDPVGIYRAARPDAALLNKWKSNFKTKQGKYLALSYIRALGGGLIKKMGYDLFEMESVLNMPDIDSDNGLISWSTIMSDIGGFSPVKQIRKILYNVLSNNNTWNEESAITVKENETIEYNEVIKYIIKRVKDLKIDSLMKERDMLVKERDMLVKERDMLVKERDMLINSFSWKLTKPLRFLYGKLRVLNIKGRYSR